MYFVLVDPNNQYVATSGSRNPTTDDLQEAQFFQVLELRNGRMIISPEPPLTGTYKARGVMLYLGSPPPG